jgi:hypothetical protein
VVRLAETKEREPVFEERFRLLARLARQGHGGSLEGRSDPLHGVYQRGILDKDR